MDFAAQAFRYAADNGARIASCSWSSSNSGGLGDAIDYFLASGGLIFKSAGNAGDEATDYMTAREDIISVAATDASDVKASFSSYGTWVDISAPGEDIMSLYHVHDDESADYVASASGTSMAAPLAAGVAALVWSRNPAWTAAQVQQRLFDTADDIDGLAGNSSYAGKLGAGRVNAYNAVNTGGPSAPNAAFAGSPTSGCSPLTVSFADQSTGEITSWSWTFGDGGSSTVQGPSHTYNAAGTYEVSLTVTGPGGSDSETKTSYITVSTSPVADFSGTPTSGNAPLTVSFTDMSSGAPTSWSWNFGDGGSSTAQNPSHQYSATGTYTVSLTATNTCGSTTETKTNYITVSEPTAQSMHVQSVQVTKQNFFNFIFRGNGTVRIVDASGSPVQGATVSGSWSGGASGSAQFTTNSSGEGTASSGWTTGNPDFTFCVDDVTRDGWTYEPAANEMTCGSTTGSSSATVAAANVENRDLKSVLENSAVAYPNPFNPSTTISFYIPENSRVRVEIYDILGRSVNTLLDDDLQAGVSSVRWNGTDANGRHVGSGQYIYRISTPNGTNIIRRMMLLK